MKPIQDFLGYKVGDIITLSDLQTQTDYKKMSVDFGIKEIRSYKEPNGVFSYTGYVIGTESGDLLILLKTMRQASVYELYVFYRDTAAPVYEAAAGQESCPLYALMTPDKDNLIERFNANVTDASGTREVTWDRQTVSHGVLFESTEGEEGITSLGEYFTNDQNNENSFCLVDWKGDAKKGYLEVWYGCPLKDHEIAMFHKD